MKQIIVLAMLAGVFFTSCGGQKKAENSGTETEKTIATVNLTKDEFLSKVANFETNPEEWIFLGDKPAIVDFYASWCGPCKQIAPILEELAKEYSDDIVIYKVNTDEEPELAAAFGIQSIPSLLFIPMNADPQMTQGAMSKAEYKETIDKLLLNKQ